MGGLNGIIIYQVLLSASILSTVLTGSWKNSRNVFNLGLSRYAGLQYLPAPDSMGHVEIMMEVKSTKYLKFIRSEKAGLVSHKKNVLIQESF